MKEKKSDKFAEGCEEFNAKNKSDAEKGKKLVDSMVHKITLRLFRVGCDETNFKILEYCKSFHTGIEIQTKFGMSAMSISRRTKALRDAKLIEDSIYKQSPIGKLFLELMAEMEKDVLKEMVNLI